MILIKILSISNKFLWKYLLCFTGLSTGCRCGWTFYLSWGALPCLSASSHNISWCRWCYLSINSWHKDRLLSR